MKLKGISIVCFLLLASSSILAQAEKQPPNTADIMRQGFGEVADWVSKSAEMVPAEKYSYKPVDTVRTFGQLIGHITDSYNFFCSRGAGDKVEWSDPVEKGTTDKATLVPKLKQALDKCNAVYSSSTGNTAPLMNNIAHTSLHYGNIITYMRMLGLKPPSS
jgi:uncharacterized damage-inducible protein DinB